MTGFHDVRFPDAVARGATGGPEFSTDIIAVASGFEQRNVNWSAARARYDISTGIRTREQMAEVIAFFRARKGRAYGFRFRDWNDFDATGQPLAATADPLVWQLAKRYASGPSADQHTITKPVAGTVVVRVNGNAVAVTVDHLTGRVTFGAAPGAQPYADFQFDVPVRSMPITCRWSRWHTTSSRSPRSPSSKYEHDPEIGRRRSGMIMPNQESPAHEIRLPRARRAS